MGGAVYIKNIIRTLSYLDNEEKPEIYLFYRSEFSDFVKDIEYPYLNLVEWHFPSIARGHMQSWIKRRNVFISPILSRYELDTVFPLQDYPLAVRTNVKLVSWIADFQYKYYPEFFTRIQLLGRTTRLKLALRHTNHFVVSSLDAKNDLETFYRVRKKTKIHIYRFVSIKDDSPDILIEDLRPRYNLPENYYLISNQFHKHKNHRVVLQAVAGLKQEGHKIYLLITGKLPQDSDSPYLNDLNEIIESNKLEDQVRFLGVIPRKDQLKIMEYSAAVIQPSKFEGWSTVIEDAKSLQVPVIASNLRVNMEQLGEAGTFFDPDQVGELMQILKDYPARDRLINHYEDYNIRVREAARTLLWIFKN
ncbi:MAG: glycosyltransferase family 1 protein [Bacteroidales bacterium]|nr:glycosyltransferase family 1 protein [Bacteroidales bacterium]